MNLRKEHEGFECDTQPFLRKHSVDFLLPAAALVYYIFCLLYTPFDLYDESYLYYIAFAMGKGQRLFEDIHLRRYFPGLFYLFHFLFKLTGPSIIWPRILMVVGMAFTPWLFYRSARWFAGYRVALLFALVILVVPGPMDKFYAGLLNMGLIYCSLGLLFRYSRGWAIGMGAFLGSASVLRVDAAVAGIVLFAAVIVLRLWAVGDRGKAFWAPVGTTMATFSAIFVPVQVFFIHQGIFLNHLRQWILPFRFFCKTFNTFDVSVSPPPSMIFGCRAGKDWRPGSSMLHSFLLRL